MKSRIQIASAAFLVLAAVDTACAGQFVQISPEWVKKHPGRLQMSIGSAFNGSNTFTFRFFADEPAAVDVRMELHEREGHKRMILVSGCTVEAKRDSVVFSVMVYPEFKYKPVFRVIERVPITKENGMSYTSAIGTIYTLDVELLADVDGIPPLTD